MKVTNLGYVKLYRKSLDSVVWQNPNTWKVWSYCLIRANHKEAEIPFGDEVSILKPGQFITGRYTGAQECNMSPSTFWSQILKLKKLKYIDTFSDNKKTVITIVNWDVEQSRRDNTDTKADINPTPIRHRQECKNEENTPPDFEKFWDLYGKKADRVKSLKKWMNLPEAVKEKIFTTLPAYISATPELKYRKNPLTYLNGECWNDEQATPQINYKPKWDYENEQIQN
ncbi:MAG: hypothetical protein NTX65_14965 [Ignavibacteriales bacterium]|nr:hypothetical protein [Ignavibacteriales bacterium]